LDARPGTEARIEIQRVARATTPTIAATIETARMTSAAGENSRLRCSRRAVTNRMPAGA
jgi:hypothetical protein